MLSGSRKSRIGFGVAVVVTTLVCLATLALASTPFVLEIAGPRPGAMAMALDNQGNPHIAYRYALNADLMYVTKVGGVWQTPELVQTGGDYGNFVAIAVDGDGNPHIIHRDWDTGYFWYVTKLAGVWQPAEYVAGGWSLSLALDADGNPHMCCRSNASRLYYVKKVGGSWQGEVADFEVDTGDDPSLAVDALGNPHISYYLYPEYDLKYARKIGGSWQTVKLDSVGIVGQATSLALDAQGNPHITYYDDTNAGLKYIYRIGDAWQSPVAIADVGSYTYSAIAVDGEGKPHVCFYDASNGDVEYMRMVGISWQTAIVDADASMAYPRLSLALDPYGNPHVGYANLRGPSTDMMYATSAIQLTSPAGGETWPVGSLKTIEWSGVGPVNVHLSVDGGNSFDLLASSVTGGSNPNGGSYALRVPHRPSKFCVIKVERADPFSVAKSDSFFTIETSVSLLSLMAVPAADGVGNLVSWSTDPGPEDLAGYRLQKRAGEGDWFTLLSLTKNNSHHDVSGSAGDGYRLFAVNGFGEELYLGETSNGDTPALGATLKVWPVPYREGELNVSFPTGGPGGTSALTEVVVYDVSGRRVTTIARGTFPVGSRQATWNGRDDNGKRVASGVYFYQLNANGVSQTKKMLLLR